MNVCIVYNMCQKYREGIWRELSKDSWNFSIYCDYLEGDSIQQIEKNKIQGFNPEGELKIFPILKNIYFNRILIFQKGLIKLALKKCFDQYIMLGDCYSLSTWMVILILKIRKKKIIVWSHGPKGNELFFKKFLYKTFFSLCDIVLTYGRFGADSLKKIYKIKGQTKVIYNSLDWDKQNDILSKLKGIENKGDFKYFCYIGRIQPRKKIDILLECFSELLNSKSNFDFKLILIGDGPDLEVYREQYEGPNILFLGAIYDEEVIAKYLYNSEAMISPGHVGLNVLHALGYGTLVITHNNHLGHAPEFEALNEEVCILFDENSKSSLRLALMELNKSNLKKDDIRSKCIEIIKSKYNPNHQKKVIKSVLKTI